MTAVTHRRLVDAEELIDRTHRVALIVESLRTKPEWAQADDADRRAVAKRFGFARWAFETGEINDYLYPSQWGESGGAE